MKTTKFDNAIHSKNFYNTAITPAEIDMADHKVVMGRYRYSVFLSVFLDVGIGIFNTAGIGIFAHCPTVLFGERERFSRSLYMLSSVCRL